MRSPSRGGGGELAGGELAIGRARVVLARVASLHGVLVYCEVFHGPLIELAPTELT